MKQWDVILDQSKCKNNISQIFAVLANLVIVFGLRKLIKSRNIEVNYLM
jgi:hypothetical protein